MGVLLRTRVSIQISQLHPLTSPPLEARTLQARTLVMRPHGKAAEAASVTPLSSQAIKKTLLPSIWPARMRISHLETCGIGQAAATLTLPPLAVRRTLIALR